MKKILFTLVLTVFAGAFALNAQTDDAAAKACCKKSASTADAAKVSEAAEALAMNDETIEKRVCEHSGNVSYVRKAVATDGSSEPQFIPVVYNAETGKFEDKPKSEDKNCSDKEKASGCCSKSAAAQKDTKAAGAQEAKPMKAAKAN